MNGVTAMANNYFKAWTVGQTNSNGNFAAISGTNSNSMSDMMNIANQYSHLNANRTQIKAAYNDLVNSENFNIKDFLSSGSSSSQDSTQVADAIIKDATNLKDSAKILTSTSTDSIFTASKDGNVDMKKVTEAVDSFVDSYNKVVSSIASSGNTSVLQKGAIMLNQSATNYNSLSNVGITVNTNGKLSIDSKKLESANINDLKSLFQGNDSYAAKIANTAQNVTQAAQSNQYKTYSNTGAASFSLASTLGNFVNYTA